MRYPADLVGLFLTTNDSHDMLKHPALLLALGAIVALPLASLHAASNASDNAANYSGNYPGGNAGTGFGPFTLSTTNGNNGGAGVFLGSASGNAAGSGGGIDTGGQSFGLYAYNGGQALVNRSFTADAGGNTALTQGQTFSLGFDNGYVSNGGTVGVNFLGADGSTRLNFQFAGGAQDYTYTAVQPGAVNGAGDTGVRYTADGLNLTFTQGANNTFTFTVSALGGATMTETGTLYASDISGFQVYNNNATGSDTNNGGNYNLFFNSPTVTGAVPEPGHVALLGVSGLSLAFVGLRRWRRVRAL